VEATLLELSVDLPHVLATPSVTNIAQLKAEYARRYPLAPPLFQTYDPKSVTNGNYPMLALPRRDYYWLRSWSGDDPGSTPLFWSYFHLPRGVNVEYISVDGAKHRSSSSNFALLLAPISNRIELRAIVSQHPTNEP
jgi:hypothetical protein